MTVFVVLHYENLKDTVICIESILTCLSHESIRVIIMDNNSPNNSGIELKEKYHNNQQIDVLLNDNNIGFSKGNNVGCVYAIEKYNPDFICVVNNDTYINDNQFIDKIIKAYALESFDALGPKIWNTKRNYNQNPFKVISSLNEVIEALEIHQRGTKYLNSFFPLSYYFYNKYLIRKKIHKTDGLHGSAIIFSKQYYLKFPKVIPEITFFYGEENFLNYRRIKHNLKFIHDFSIQIYHNHSSTTRRITKNVIKKWKYQHNFIGIALNKLIDIYANNTDI